MARSVPPEGQKNKSPRWLRQREDLERITVTSKRVWRACLGPRPGSDEIIQFGLDGPMLSQPASLSYHHENGLSTPGGQITGGKPTGTDWYRPVPAGTEWAGPRPVYSGPVGPGATEHHGRGTAHTRAGLVGTGQDGPRRAEQQPGAGEAPTTRPHGTEEPAEVGPAPAVLGRDAEPTNGPRPPPSQQNIVF